MSRYEQPVNDVESNEVTSLGYIAVAFGKTAFSVASRIFVRLI